MGFGPRKPIGQVFHGLEAVRAGPVAVGRSGGGGAGSATQWLPDVVIIGGLRVQDQRFRDVTDRLGGRLAQLGLPGLPAGVRVVQCVLCSGAAVREPSAADALWDGHDAWCRTVQAATIALHEAAMAVTG